MGTHVRLADFTQYIGRFNMMPGNNTGDSMYHSFNVGPVHVVMLSSEMYFYVSGHGMALLPQQYAWLEADLAAVNRTATPWIITMAHRPMYCSPNDDDDDCHSLISLVRDGFVGEWALEPLIYKYGVDVHFGAHEHSYERNYPVYRKSYSHIASNKHLSQVVVLLHCGSTAPLWEYGKQFGFLPADMQNFNGIPT
jgi:hypothetical protein